MQHSLEKVCKCSRYCIYMLVSQSHAFVVSLTCVVSQSHAFIVSLTGVVDTVYSRYCIYTCWSVSCLCITYMYIHLVVL